jgi:hypothetical protein
MKTAAGIDGPGTADLLKQIIHRRFKPKFFSVGGIRLWLMLRIN